MTTRNDDTEKDRGAVLSGDEQVLLRAGKPEPGSNHVVCANWAKGGTRTKRRRSKYVSLGQVRDVEGDLWEIHEIRETEHGFDLLFGKRVSHLEDYKGGLPRLIATQALWDYWEANRIKHDGTLFDLPAGRTTLKRMRARLGFNYFEDFPEFWKERIEDLETLSPREFAERHKVDLWMVIETRRELLGRRARLLNWWRTPRTLEVLRCNITLREMGEKLGISITHTKRLRDRVREEDERLREPKLAA